MANDYIRKTNRPYKKTKQKLIRLNRTSRGSGGNMVTCLNCGIKSRKLLGLCSHCLDMELGNIDYKHYKQ